MRLWDAMYEGKGKAHNKHYSVRFYSWTNQAMHGETYEVTSRYSGEVNKFDTHTSTDAWLDKSYDWKPGLPE